MVHVTALGGNFVHVVKYKKTKALIYLIYRIPFAEAFICTVRVCALLYEVDSEGLGFLLVRGAVL